MKTKIRQTNWTGELRYSEGPISLEIYPEHQTTVGWVWEVYRSAIGPAAERGVEDDLLQAIQKGKEAHRRIVTEKQQKQTA